MEDDDLLKMDICSVSIIGRPGDSIYKIIKAQQCKNWGWLKSVDYRMKQPNFRAIKRGVPRWKVNGLKNKWYLINKDNDDEKLKIGC